MEETNELQQMPEIQNIAEYLRNMKFRKKTFGGCDAESVLEHFAAVSQMYEAIICANKQQVDQYARQLAALQARCAAKEEEQAAQQWYAPPVQQPMQQPAPPMPVQQPYMAQNPWAPAWAPDLWAQQAVPPQSYYPPQLVPQQMPPQAPPYAWPEEQESLPEPAYQYA